MAADNTSLDEHEALDKASPLTADRGAKSRRWLVLLPLIILAVAAGGYFGVQWWLYTRAHVSTDDARVKGTLITISTEVPGRLINVPVEAGQRIKKGDMLAQIQPDTYQSEAALRAAALESARSQLASAEVELILARVLVEGQIQRSDAVLGASRSELAGSRQAAQLERQRLQASLREKEAAIEEAKARLVGAKTTMGMAAGDLKRIQELFREGIVAAEQQDQAAAAHEVAIAQHQSAQEGLNKSKALLQLAQAEGQRVQLRLDNVRTQQGRVRESEALKDLAVAERQRSQVKEAAVQDLRARVKEAEAQLAIAHMRLAETTITSPIDGVVSQVIADPGERVQPGQPIVIINDPQDVWISANIEETHIRKVNAGQAVEIDVDAYPQRTFQGKVWQIGAATRSEFAIIPSGSASAHFIKVTQRIPVRIRVDNSDNLLKPGMMVVVAIRVE